MFKNACGSENWQEEGKVGQSRQRLNEMRPEKSATVHDGIYAHRTGHAGVH